MAPQRPPAACSAPGKVLLAGGYLVLDRAYTGLSFGLDARIHVHVKELETSSGVAIHGIIVKSPQFPGATWRYGYTQGTDDAGVHVTQLTSGMTHAPRNPFVETALAYALSYIATFPSAANIEPSVVTILADDDYYSTPAGQSVAQRPLPSRSRFRNFPEPLWDAHKTGLGSSAALVTSLTAALLAHYLNATELDLDSTTGRNRLHNLSQAAHCAAQGKIGSGFDVASAVYGSCVYRRFSPTVLESLGEIEAPGFATRLRDCVNDSQGKWDAQVSKDAVAIPSGMKLVMCDVDCGSKTPGMVKKVLQWRKQKPEEAEGLWQTLHATNESLAQELVDSESSHNFGKVEKVLGEVRGLIRKMSQQSDVPIEPPAQTRLLDACSEISGVVGGVVPGAGGYDAVALLVEDKDETMRELSKLLQSWRFEGDGSSAGAGAGAVRLLSTKGEMQGLRIEQPEDYDDWI